MVLELQVIKQSLQGRDLSFNGLRLPARKLHQIILQMRLIDLRQHQRKTLQLQKSAELQQIDRIKLKRLGRQVEVLKEKAQKS
jgi:hypothetical protein